MKKILVFSNGTFIEYKFRKEVLQALTKKYEVVLCAPFNEYIRELENIGVRLINLPFIGRGTNIKDEIKLFNNYKKTIKNEKPDLISTYTIKPNIYAGYLARKNSIPYIANITGLGTAMENEGLLQKILILMYKKAFKNINCVFFQNEQNKNFFLNHMIIKNQPYEIIPGSGVNTGEYPYREYPDDKTIRFVFIARIMKEKGIDEYLESAKKLKEKYSNLEFHVCGKCTPEYRERINALNEDGTIIYHGLVNNISKFLENIHCTVHPTYYPEGMSNVLLESGSTGRPIITTDRPGCREIIEDGNNGYIILEKDTEKLANAIEKFIRLSNENKKKMGINARKVIEVNFSRDFVVVKYLNTITEILSGNKND